METLPLKLLTKSYYMETKFIRVWLLNIIWNEVYFEVHTSLWGKWSLDVVAVVVVVVVVVDIHKDTKHIHKDSAQVS